MIRTQIDLDARRRAVLDVARHRLMVAFLLFLSVFAIIGGRIIYLGLAGYETGKAKQKDMFVSLGPRADIVDRNGILLATNVATKSLYANPKIIADPDYAATQLARVLPGLSVDWLRKQLNKDDDHVWIKWHLTPDQVWRVNSLGLVGLEFADHERRLYPHGTLVAHTIGAVDVSGRGLQGTEKYWHQRLGDPDQISMPLVSSLDIRVQQVLVGHLARAIREHQALAGAGLVMDVQTGEILALASWPDFDPNRPGASSAIAQRNLVTWGLYEMGSVFKIFTIAASLEAGLTRMQDGYDASRPIRIAGHAIHDYHPKNRWLRVPEIFAYSSNIGTARMADALGPDRLRDFLSLLGLLKSAQLDLAEVRSPFLPAKWGRVQTMTIGFGHGLAVAPMQLVNGVAAIINGGVAVPATLVRRNRRVPATEQRRVVSGQTSRAIRQLMRLVVEKGTGKAANVPGYYVGGKTGTAEKVKPEGYREGTVLASFIGAFPIDVPRYLVFVMLDEPQGTEASGGRAGGGAVAAPIAARIIAQTAPLLGMAPVPEDPGFVRKAAVYMEGRTP